MTRDEFRALEARLGLTKTQTAAICGGVHIDTVAKWRSGARGIPGYAARLLTIEAERRERDHRP